MGRLIGAVVVGYLVIFGLVFGLFNAAYFALGADGSFKPGSYEVSATWLVVSFVVGLVAAIAGGYVCATIAGRWNAPLVLAGAVIVLGLMMAMPALMATPAKTERTAGVGTMEAMMNARTPAWVALLNPFVGAGGVLIGAGLRRKK